MAEPEEDSRDRRGHAAPCRPAEADLFAVGRTEGLEELDLKLLRISDKGLAQLKNLKNLKRLNLAMVVVPDEAVTALQAAIPGLDVLRWRIPGGWP